MLVNANCAGYVWYLVQTVLRNGNQRWQMSLTTKPLWVISPSCSKNKPGRKQTPRASSSRHPAIKDHKTHTQITRV